MTKNEFDFEAHKHLTANVIAELLFQDFSNADNTDWSINLDAWFEAIKPILKEQLEDRYGKDLEIQEEN